MDVFFILLTSFSIVSVNTATLNGVCKEASCSMEPDGACTVTCHTGILATRLPDGPLRELPGTVRKLTLLVDNSVKGTDPTVVIGWLSPKDVLVTEYEVYLMTWDNAVPPLESAALPHIYLVNTSHPSGQQQITVRVTSSSFRGMNDIIVYVNTWVGGRQPCHLRQAKTTFYTMASTEPTSTRWHYFTTMSLPSYDVINVNFSSFPGAELHDLELCKLDDITEHESCQAVTLYEPVRTTNFNISKNTCRTYRLSIIPDPNPNNEVVEVKVLIPDLNCSVCKDDTWFPPHQLPLTEQSTDLLRSSVRETLPVQTVAWSVVASLVGLIGGIMFVVMAIRRHRHLRAATGMKMDSSFQPNNDLTLGDSIPDITHKHTGKAAGQHGELVKRVCIVYHEDSTCHQEVVKHFADFLNFRFDVKLVTCADILSHEASETDVTVLVSSDAIFRLLHEPTQFCQSQTGSRRTPCLIDVLQSVAVTGKLIIVRFDYTKRHLPLFCDNVTTLNLTEELRALLCNIDESDVVDVSWTDRDLQDLMTSTQRAITCHDKVGLVVEGCDCMSRKDTDGKSCVSWFTEVRPEEIEETSHVDDGKDYMLPPTPVSEYDSMLSVNQQLIEINRYCQIDY